MSRTDPGPDDVAALADVMHEVTHCRDTDETREALETMPIAGVLFVIELRERETASRKIAGDPADSGAVD